MHTFVKLLKHWCVPDQDCCRVQAQPGVVRGEQPDPLLCSLLTVHRWPSLLCSLLIVHEWPQLAAKGHAGCRCRPLGWSRRQRS